MVFKLFRAGLSPGDIWVVHGHPDQFPSIFLKSFEIVCFSVAQATPKSALRANLKVFNCLTEENFMTFLVSLSVSI